MLAWKPGLRLQSLPVQATASARAMGATVGADAVPTQEIPRVDAAGVAVVPAKGYGVSTCRCYVYRSRRVLIKRQEVGWSGLGRSRGAAIFFAFFDAGGAGAGVAQPAEGPGTAVTIFPVNFHARAFRLMHFDASGLGGVLRQILIFEVAPPRFLFPDNANSFVARGFTLRILRSSWRSRVRILSRRNRPTSQGRGPRPPHA